MGRGGRSNFRGAPVAPPLDPPLKQCPHPRAPPPPTFNIISKGMMAYKSFMEKVSWQLRASALFGGGKLTGDGRKIRKVYTSKPETFSTLFVLSTKKKKKKKKKKSCLLIYVCCFFMFIYYLFIYFFPPVCLDSCYDLLFENQ